MRVNIIATMYERPRVFKGAVSRNSAKLGNYKMSIKLRETKKKAPKSLKES